MTTIGETSIVYNNPSKIMGLPPYYYRLRKCNTNLTGFTPADQYQKQKLIQNTVRVNSSLYTSNLAPLSAYKQPTSVTHGVCWNQMSDRPVASVQRASIPTGYNNSLNGRHTSRTSSKPGSQTPGGIGCDIKHNSYDRYLNRLKGKGPLRRGVITDIYGLPLPFNPAFPIYGGKTVKTNIVNGCDCPIATPENNLKQDIKIYDNPLWQPYPTSKIEFNVGDFVYAKEDGKQYYSKATILSIDNGIYTIQFQDGTIQTVDNVNDLSVYFPCNCNDNTKLYSIPSNLFIAGYTSQIGLECTIPESLLLGYTVI
jgi:hypothetical protein